jgi:gliding motility-associated lipoprotein GldJ
MNSNSVRLRIILSVFVLSTFAACSLFKKKDKTETQSFEEMQAGRVEGVSQITGIPYNDSTVNNSMMVAKYIEMPNAPNMVFIEGGSFVMGITEEDVINLARNRVTRVSVPSFFMDRTEIANIHWLEFMNFFYKNRDSIPAGMTFEEYAEEILLPDTTVWASEVAANDAYVKSYLRHPGFRLYPVVGVSWIQAQEFCKWRTKMVNHHYVQEKSSYTGVALDGKLTVGKLTKVKEKANTSIQYPDYRLPTEAEWEYAAKAMVATQYDDVRASKQRLYPWDGKYVRNPYKPNTGLFMANFKHGRGDYAGIAGRQNDGAMLTASVYSYPPNDFGLYNMAGNVNEWVEDAYFIEGYEDFGDLRQAKRAATYLDSTYQNKMTLDIMLYGRSDTTLKGKKLKLEKQYKDTIDIARENLMNFPSALGKNLIGLPGIPTPAEKLKTFKVYKGGSWKDVAYWLAPGTRRYLEMDKSLPTLGFRCAMNYAPKKEVKAENTITSESGLSEAQKKKLAKYKAQQAKQAKKAQKKQPKTKSKSKKNKNEVEEEE